MSNKTGLKSSVQRMGSFLSGMVMPNIAAFIAWGLITALFIPTGWIPHEGLGSLVGPMLNYLLPIMVAYTGGTMIHEHRGGVVAAASAMGVIVGAGIPMFMGAMIVGPLAAWLMKKIDEALVPKIPQGFEMLINNFSAGILAVLLAIGGYFGIGPVVEALNNALAAGVNAIIKLGILPLVHLFVEPAKVLFLNNAINHGIFGPLGLEQAAEAGKSIIFMLESNPGPGLGILVSFMAFGKGSAKASASSAAIIHFFGGIHEIYFPYVLMKPALIVAAMAGGMAGTATFQLLNAGLVATPSPGSIIAYLLMTPKGEYIPVLAGVLVAAVVSFLVASIILKRDKSLGTDLGDSVAKMEEMKGKKSSVSSALKTDDAEASDSEAVVDYKNVKNIVFACDAGMGSSAMGATLLRKKIKEAGFEDISVTNSAIKNLTGNEDLVVTHKDLTENAKQKVPNGIHVSVENFLGSPKYDEIVENLKNS
ncbi:MAG TPA: PTS mannitol transporter subunit IICB [Clostridiaceae bacterium]|nr:PTS mannitol transporter subunit IICB [Clostridiaceae bacterium]